MSFYGDFLVQLGVVRQDELAAALAEQAEGRTRLGDLAVARGLLTPEQVEQVRRCQRGPHLAHGDLRFGELAVALGFATTAQMEALHAEQRAGWRRIGEILVKNGAIDAATHESYLRDFVHTELIRRRRLEASMAEAPHPRVVEQMVDLARRWLPRFGLADAKVVDVRIAPRATRGVTWAGRRSLVGPVEILTFLAVSTPGLAAIARSTERPVVEGRPDLALPALAELVDTLTELLRDRLGDLALAPATSETFPDDGFQALADLVAERDLLQVEFVHGAPAGTTERAVLTLVTRQP
ncbi:MAG: hypothetical protein D6798_14700 [Deltaproteobacteria bacterium]|nr:MAG: hypothetical protein D6798_14700 [Deltaproteobacteria bacterium]